MSKQAREPIVARPKWNAVLAVCTKCEDGDSSFPRRLKEAMKARDSREIRVVFASCLDICPKRGICASLVGHGATTTYVFDEKYDPQSAIDLLLSGCD